MFEKEADEYAKEVYGNRTDIDHYGIPEAFQNGAEFGYNKANEWHYVKDGKYPKENKTVIAIYNFTDELVPILTLYRDKKWVNIFQNYTDIIYPIIAWKEIVLPELKESE